MWVSACQFRATVRKEFADGILMVTRGAVYVINVGSVGEMSLKWHFSLLDCAAFCQNSDSIVFFIRMIPVDDDQAGPVEIIAPPPGTGSFSPSGRMKSGLVKLEVRSPHAERIALILGTILQDALFGIPSPPAVDVTCTRAPEIITSRPKNSLKRRAMLLAHFYRKQPEPLDSCQYFQENWDGRQGLYLDKSFDPGKFGIAYGQAVAWEAALKTICFKAAQFEQFGVFLDNILFNSIAIEGICFLDYPKETVLNFRFQGIDKTSIVKWRFFNSSARVICGFLEASARLPPKIEEIVLAKQSYNKKDGERIFNGMLASEPVRCIKALGMISLNFEVFPSVDFSKAINGFRGLRHLSITDMNVDGTALLGTICSGTPWIVHLSLIAITFLEPKSRRRQLALPSNLVALDVSRSKFLGGALGFLFNYITSQQRKDTFIFLARRIEISEQSYAVLSRMHLAKCHANIREFNFSGNFIASIGFDLFFKFLVTQKRMKSLVLNDIVTDECSGLLAWIIPLVKSLQLKRLELSVEFHPIVMEIFVPLLVKCVSLKSLYLKDTFLGNEGIKAVTHLLQVLPNIKEFAGDGFHPGKEDKKPLLKLWEMIGKSSTIRRCDYPEEDLKSAEIDPRELRWLKYVKAKEKPKTQRDRIAGLTQKRHM
jgi:hypothetical protein